MAVVQQQTSVLLASVRLEAAYEEGGHSPVGIHRVEVNHRAAEALRREENRREVELDMGEDVLADIHMVAVYTNTNQRA